MPHPFDRKLRVSHLLQQALATLLLNSQDPRFKFVSITGISISKDYSYADIFVTMLQEEEAQSVITALNKAAGYFRHELAHQVNLRTTPRLRFQYDDTLDRGQRIFELLAKKPNSNQE